MSYIRIFDYFFILRPMLHLPVWTVLLLGYYSYDYSHGNKWNLLLALVLGTALFGGVFLINQIYDIESDRINNKLHFLPRGIIKVSVAWLMTILLNLVSLIGGFVISFKIGLVISAVVLLGILYSVPPIALKNRPWSAAIANGLGHGTLVYLIGYCTAGGGLFTGAIKSLPYFFAVAAVYIGTTLPDIDGDRLTGKRTIGVDLGERTSIYIVILCYLIALVFGIIVSDKPFLYAALAAGLFYMYALLKRSIKPVVLALKVSILTLTLAAGYMMPLYILSVIILVFLTRAYYKARFNMEYPSIN